MIIDSPRRWLQRAERGWSVHCEPRRPINTFLFSSTRVDRGHGCGQRELHPCAPRGSSFWIMPHCALSLESHSLAMYVLYIHAPVCHWLTQSHPCQDLSRNIFLRFFPLFSSFSPAFLRLSIDILPDILSRCFYPFQPSSAIWRTIDDSMHHVAVVRESRFWVCSFYRKVRK